MRALLLLSVLAAVLPGCSAQDVLVYVWDADQECYARTTEPFYVQQGAVDRTLVFAEDHTGQCWHYIASYEPRWDPTPSERCQKLHEEHGDCYFGPEEP